MKKIQQAVLFMICLYNSITTIAQEEKKNPFTISAYGEIYYLHDLNKPINNTRPPFVYSHNRSNEVNINLAYIKGNYTVDRLRANLAIGAGTYMNANYSAEPGVLKNVFEVNAGVKLSASRNLWIDAGVMPSHLGFESAIGKDNWTVTRSMLADNSPYFETGARLSYTTNNEKWYLALLYLNGWQRIQRADGNSTPAFGTQVTYKPSQAVTINYSTFIGSDKPDSIRQMRYFQNLYSIIQVSKKFGITAGIDVGLEQKNKGGKQYNHWYTPILIMKYAPDTKNSVTARAEYYDDANGVIINSVHENGFSTFGWSINYDKTLFGNMMWRLEVRNLLGKEAYFNKADNTLSSNTTFFTTALTFGF